MNSVLKVPRTRRATPVLGALVGVLVFSIVLFSQSNFGRILGIVTDQTGGVVSGATVTVIDTQRGVARTLTTDDAFLSIAFAHGQAYAFRHVKHI